MEWISVNDRLPPQTVYVLVAHFDHRDKVKMYFISIAERIGDYWYEGKDGDEITYGGKYGKVTHWMPLPDPPIALPEPVDHIPDARKMIETPP